jgi:hypothetical protein
MAIDVERSAEEYWDKVLTVSYAMKLHRQRVTQAQIRDFREEAQRVMSELAAKYFEAGQIEERGSYGYEGFTWSGNYWLDRD